MLEFSMVGQGLALCPREMCPNGSIKVLSGSLASRSRFLPVPCGLCSHRAVGIECPDPQCCKHLDKGTGGFQDSRTASNQITSAPACHSALGIEVVCSTPV